MTDPATTTPTEEPVGPLGTYVGDDAPTPKPEKATPEATPAKAEPDESAPEPEAEPEAEPEPEPADEFEDLSLEDLDKRIAEAIKKAVPAEDPEDDGLDDRTRALMKERDELKQRLETAEREQSEREDADAIAKLEHSVKSTSGKYKMTAEERATVVKYMQANEDLVAGGMGFEEAALRRLPGLADRLKTSPQPPARPPGENGVEGIVDVPATTGAGAPKPWKHTPKPGDYSDITAHAKQTGEAATLGRYT